MSGVLRERLRPLLVLDPGLRGLGKDLLDSLHLGFRRRISSREVGFVRVPDLRVLSERGILGLALVPYAQAAAHLWKRSRFLNPSYYSITPKYWYLIFITNTHAKMWSPVHSYRDCIYIYISIFFFSIYHKKKPFSLLSQYISHSLFIACYVRGRSRAC